MLDENLPTFFLKATAEGKHKEAYYFTQHGTEPEAAYILKHLDPASQEAKNTYAAALVDPHIPGVVFAEVLARPGWTLPTLSQEEIRRNGGITPPPQPIFPTEFAIQLYNPDQQVVVKQHVSKWTNAVSYEFSMPQTSFRTPSSSELDRIQEDPLADPSAPKINFVWKKEGRIGKDMTCYLTGKSTDMTGKKAKKSKEPDITIALFSSLKEMTIMEPNLYRVEMEDYKGLEVVLLLGAAVIRDISFGNPREAFHIIDPAARKNSAGLRGRNGSSPTLAPNVTPPLMTPQPPRQSPEQIQGQFPPKAAAVQGLYSPPTRVDPRRASVPPPQTASQHPQRLDPRAQWEIDAETARLKAQAEAEAREQKRKAEKARRKAEEEEERKTRKFLEQEEKQRKQEEKERRRRQAEVDAETERLRKQFGDQSNLLPQIRPQPPPRQGNLHPPSLPQQRHSAPLLQHPSMPSQRPPPQPARPSHSGPYLQPPQGPGPAASQSSFFSGYHSNTGGQPKMKKKSLWGLRSASDSSANTLRKKQSSMF